MSLNRRRGDYRLQDLTTATGESHQALDELERARFVVVDGYIVYIANS